MSQLPFRQQLEEHNNPEEVRQRLVDGNYNQAQARIAQEYLDSLSRKDMAESAAKRDAREEETLSIAREALRNSNRANIIAISAIIFSVITAAIIAWYTVKYGN